MKIPYIQPSLSPGGYEIFESVASDFGCVCEACGKGLWVLDEGTFGHRFLVCPSYGTSREAPRNHSQRLLSRLREIRALGMMTQVSDWPHHWPDVALDYGLVRRVNPRRGDALQVATIKAMIHGGRYVVTRDQTYESVVGRPRIYGLEGLNWDDVPIDCVDMRRHRESC